MAKYGPGASLVELRGIDRGNDARPVQDFIVMLRQNVNSLDDASQAEVENLCRRLSLLLAEFVDDESKVRENGTEILRRLSSFEATLKRTRDRRYIKAANILAEPPITDGRNRIHDAPRLLRMAWLIHNGHASGAWSAAGIVAGEIEGHSFNAVRKRLYRKFLKQKGFYTYVGPFICHHIEFFEDGATNAIPT